MNNTSNTGEDELNTIVDELVQETIEQAYDWYGHEAPHDVGYYDHTLPEAKQKLRALIQKSQKAYAEELCKRVIGEEVTQQERHWSNEDGDFCGHDGTMTDVGCICDELNALKYYQHQILSEELDKLREQPNE